MSTALAIATTALVLSFVFCCVLSGILQVLAWSLHMREGAPVTFRALRDPVPYFDPIGVRQILVSRRLLTVGVASYLTYGFLILAANFLR